MARASLFKQCAERGVIDDRDHRDAGGHARAWRFRGADVPAERPHSDVASLGSSIGSSRSGDVPIVHRLKLPSSLPSTRKPSLASSDVSSLPTSSRRPSRASSLSKTASPWLRSPSPRPPGATLLTAGPQASYERPKRSVPDRLPSIGGSRASSPEGGRQRCITAEELDRQFQEYLENEMCETSTKDHRASDQLMNPMWRNLHKEGEDKLEAMEKLMAEEVRKRHHSHSLEAKMEWDLLSATEAFHRVGDTTDRVQQNIQRLKNMMAANLAY